MTINKVFCVTRAENIPLMQFDTLDAAIQECVNYYTDRTLFVDEVLLPETQSAVDFYASEPEERIVTLLSYAKESPICIWNEGLPYYDEIVAIAKALGKTVEQG